MSEKKVLGLEELIDLMQKPIIIKTESLGDLEFRHMLDEDIIFIEDCLNEDMDNEHFCKQFLINQITNPELVLNDFNEMIHDIDKELCVLNMALDYHSKSIDKIYCRIDELSDEVDNISLDIAKLDSGIHGSSDIMKWFIPIVLSIISFIVGYFHV